jgi:phage gp46-like protein
VADLSKLDSYAVLSRTGADLSKTVAYAVLSRTGADLSKTVAYAVLGPPAIALSKLDSYAVLLSPPPPLPLPPSPPPPPAGAGGDIRVIWDNTQALGDWGLATGDVETGQDLETACLVSLFTDRAATPDFIPTDGTTDRRGWWADTYTDRPLGSNLWQLERAKKTRDTLGLARRYALDALQWLIDDGVARSILCNTGWLGPNMLGIAVAIIKPDGTASRFMFGWAWTGLAVVSSPVAFPPSLLPG